jgi:formate-nitrite transporter family protein
MNLPLRRLQSGPAWRRRLLIQPRSSTGVSRRQTKQIESQNRPNAALIHETFRAEGEQELERRWWAIVLSGLSAGLSMGLSLIVQGEFHALISDEAVVLGRQRLFTRTR